MSKRDHTPGKLKPMSLKRLPDGSHADGGNLYLLVRGNSRTWVFRYVDPEGKRRNMGLGSLDSVSLARARDLAREMRARVRDPISPVDPISVAREERDTRRSKAATKRTFRQCAEAFIETKRHGWKNPKHTAQWGSTLETYAYPILGDLNIDEIDTPHIVSVLEPIWSTKPETASRVRSRMENILSWATVSKFRSGENPARWRGHLDHIFPASRKIAQVEHHAALPYRGVSDLMTRIKSRTGNGARALEFAVLTAARSGEVRGATWDEIDLENKVWVIPSNRMKARREHRVPLSDQAIALLSGIERREGNQLIFPGTKKNKPMSDMTLSAVLRRLEIANTTVHGFRSTFRDWAAEQTSYPREACELSLAHSVGSAVEQAYRRGDLFEIRRNLMSDWGGYCTSDT